MTTIHIASGLLHGPAGAVPVSRAPARLLESFLTAPDNYRSIEELSVALWPSGRLPSDPRNVIRQQIYRLRATVRRVAPSADIVCRRGWGWMLAAGAEEVGG